MTAKSATVLTSSAITLETFARAHHVYLFGWVGGEATAAEGAGAAPVGRQTAVIGKQPYSYCLWAMSDPNRQLSTNKSASRKHSELDAVPVVSPGFSSRRCGT